MTRIDQITADVLAGSPETHVAILAREVVKLREAPAVVVPEVPMGTALQRLGLRLTQILDGHEFAVLEHEFLNPAIEEMQKISVLSDRVLGEGMAAVRREEWERLQKFERDTKETDSRDCSDCAHYRRSQSCPGCTHPESPQNEYAFDWLLAQRCEFYARGANQGGAGK